MKRESGDLPEVGWVSLRGKANNDYQLHEFPRGSGHSEGRVLVRSRVRAPRPPIPLPVAGQEEQCTVLGWQGQSFSFQ